jgi:predicted transglutaminase-like cysteine proteinase
MAEEVYSIMYRTGISMVVAALFAVGAAAESQAGAQAGVQASGQANVQAGHTQAQTDASSRTSAAATAQNGQANAGLTSGTAFNAALSSPLDSKKCKPGDAVNARTTEAVKSQGRTVIPKGAKLVGHVTQASARAKGETESALGIVFDKAILKNGQEIPLNVAIRALASAQGSASMAGDEMDTMGGPSGSAAGGAREIGGVTSAAGGAVGTVTNTAANVGGAASSTINSAASAGGNVAGASRGAIGGLNAAGQLTSNSQGVFGLNGLNLGAAASNSTEGVITSAGKNVHLESGTRMLLATEAQTGTASASKPPAGSKVNPKSKESRERDNLEKP